MEDRIAKLELESQRQRDQVVHLMSQVDSEKGTLQRQGERMTASIRALDEKFDKILYGNNGNIGIDKRLDRIEQVVGNIKYLWGIVITTISGIIAGVIVFLVTN